MIVICDKCKKEMQFWQVHKLIGTTTYCEDCYNLYEDNKSTTIKIKNFLKINKYKVIITIWLYISMILFSLFFF